MKLAVIGKITDVQPIPGADFIRQATVVCGDAGTWQGVVGLDILKGDRVIVFLQDAILPPDPRWDFMSKHKYRVRMSRFKGVPSEVVIVPAKDPNDDMKYDCHIGTDLTAELGVTKYSKPLPVEMAGVAHGNFPSYIPKTDEENFQRVRDPLGLIHSSEWIATLKCDGSSATAWNDDTTGALRVASRNLELEEFTPTGASNAYWTVARKYDMSQIPQGTALQFEVVGPGIQGNPMGLDELEGRAFTLYDYVNHKPCSYALLTLAAANIGIPLARPVACNTAGCILTIDDLRAMSDVKYPNGKPGEGVVIRSVDSSWSFKVLNLAYRD